MLALFCDVVFDRWVGPVQLFEACDKHVLLSEQSWLNRYFDQTHAKCVDFDEIWTLLRVSCDGS